MSSESTKKHEWKSVKTLSPTFCIVTFCPQPQLVAPIPGPILTKGRRDFSGLSSWNVEWHLVLYCLPLRMILGQLIRNQPETQFPKGTVSSDQLFFFAKMTNILTRSVLFSHEVKRCVTFILDAQPLHRFSLRRRS